MQLVKLQTEGDNGKKYYPIYAVGKVSIDGQETYVAFRVYTHEKDARGYSNMNLLASYYPNCASIGAFISYLRTGDEKFLNSKDATDKPVEKEKK